MNWTDFWVVFTVVICLGFIIWFFMVRPRIKAKKDGVSPSCPNCPVGNQKKAKRLVKDWNKDKKKAEKHADSN